MKTTVIGLFAATAICTGYATHAAAEVQSPETYSQKVSYSDLNLNSPEGAGALLNRIRRAAALVCSAGDASWMQHWTNRGYRTCVREATDQAVSDARSPTVTALHSGASKIEIAGK